MIKVLIFLISVLFVVLIESFVVCINIIPKYKAGDLRMTTVVNMFCLIVIFFVSDVVGIEILIHCLF